MTDIAARARALKDLHAAPEILVLANVWDVVSAQVVAAVPGVKALATASHSIASTFGYPDGEVISLDLHLSMVERIVDAVHIPVTMDFEAGYGNAGHTARRAMDIGVVGGNLEDQMKPLDEAVAAVAAVVTAGQNAGIDFCLNARTDAMIRAGSDSDPAAVIAEVIRRGRAFLDAGATSFFVPRLLDPAQIEEVVSALGRGVVSLIAVPGMGPSVKEMEELGVCRVSTGPFTQRVALTALQDAAVDLVAGGCLPPGTRALN